MSAWGQPGFAYAECPVPACQWHEGGTVRGAPEPACGFEGWWGDEKGCISDRLCLNYEGLYALIPEEER